ncbi:DUF3486 family protein [Luteibacter aegosomatis]|uniref:DUF3486 family protein n=1 Tax=Luteibacter aegosomatis TaxID=2911537 RepID=UPI001FF95F63|nr:DUF3486 family protein [Luteibacter aegosomatis]UPG87017.1 DUF3486 family protein [Luteibacter aegosomatis]
MAPRSKVAKLPAAVKEWLDDRLVEGNFSGYETLSAELAKRGYTISKSALHNYGQEFEDRLAAVKLSTEQARAVVASSPDDEGAVNDALMRLVQDRLFTVLVSANSDQLDLPKFARAIADLGRTTISQKKYAAEVRAQRESAAAEVEQIARKGGLTADTANEIRQMILGIGQ